MKSHLNSKVKVGYRIYKVKEMSEQTHLDQGACGLTDKFKAEIQIYTKGMDNLGIKNTILHEIIHCIYDVWGIEPKDLRSEEEIVNRITNGLMTVIQDNKEFFKRFVL